MSAKENPEVQTIEKILEEAIEKERESYEYYMNKAKQSGKPSVKKTFLSLAEMEKGHMTELNKQLTDIKAQNIVDSAITGGS